ASVKKARASADTRPLVSSAGRQYETGAAVETCGAGDTGQTVAFLCPLLYNGPSSLADKDHTTMKSSFLIKVVMCVAVALASAIFGTDATRAESGGAPK